MRDGERDQLGAVMQTRVTRLMRTWVLGEVWRTGLIAGAVIMLLWAR
jgi:hypothetical protein